MGKSRFQEIPYRLIACVPTLTNVDARFDEHNKEAQKFNLHSLARFGWVSDKGNAGVISKKSSPGIWTKKHDEALDSVYQFRRQTYDNLKHSNNPADKAVLEVKTKLWCDPKTGEVAKPEYLFVEGHGRGLVFEESQLKRFTGFTIGDITYEPQDVRDMIPCIIHEFTNHGEMLVAQIMNNTKEQGQSQMTLRDQLRASKVLRDEEAYTQSQLRDLFGANQGQRIDAWLELNNAWNPKNKDLFPGEKVREDLKIYERCLLPAKDDRAINIIKLNDVPLLLTVRDRSIPKGLEKRNKAIERANQARRAGTKSGDEELVLKPITPEDLEKYFKGELSEQKKEKSLTKDKWEQVKGNTASATILRELADSHLKGDTDAFKAFNQNADVWDTVYELIRQGKKSDVLIALDRKSVV